MKRHELVKEHIKRIRDRYQDSDRRAKGLILDEVCSTWGVGRDHVIRSLSGKSRGSQRRAGRPSKYDGSLVKHLTVIWQSMERICARRMKAALPVWIEFYEDPECGPRLKAQMLEMSASTLSRYLKRGRKTLKGLSTTRRSKFLQYKIPLHNFTDSIVKAGHVAADTVAHCGDSLLGEFVSTLTVTDRLSTWTETRALFSKKFIEMRRAMVSIERMLPFGLLSLQTDCGSEFLNYGMVDFLQNRPHPVTMTRGRPYHKNDNAHVEQKNNTHVRAIFGYDRIDNPGLVKLMNEIYEEYWCPLNNFFLPSMKLKEKERNGARITKRYESPLTPYQRLMLAPNLADGRKQELEARFKKLNPFELKRGLERKLELFFSLLKKGQVERKAA